jgi:hypothetical protein
MSSCNRRTLLTIEWLFHEELMNIYRCITISIALAAGTFTVIPDSLTEYDCSDPVTRLPSGFNVYP